MKKILLAAFKITLFQILFNLVLSGLKYTLTTYKIIDKIEKPFVWICLGAGAIFVFAIGIKGFIENRGKSFEEWNSNPEKSARDKFMAGFVSWGIAIPAVLAYVLFVYFITPTSVLMFIALYIGIVIKNCINFFSEKHAQQTID